MAMNVQAIPSLPDKVNQIRLLTAKIVNEEILPNENRLWRSRQDVDVSDKERQEARALRKSIQEKVKQAGLWAPHLPEEYGGCGLSFLEHAYMNEVLAYAIAFRVFLLLRRRQGDHLPSETRWTLVVAAVIGAPPLPEPPQA